MSIFNMDETQTEENEVSAPVELNDEELEQASGGRNNSASPKLF
jgi:hypothetical protein